VSKRGYSYGEAIAYLGIKRRAFDRHIRPRLPPPTPCGTSLVFERSDLDLAWEAYRAKRRREHQAKRGEQE
jgi:predicted DNA-binding transcriptional regulator AlpA